MDDAFFQSELSVMTDEGGMLVVKGELLGDLTDVVRHEHERRLADLIRQGLVVEDKHGKAIQENSE